MSEMIISGGIELRGKVQTSGSKNAVLPILAASLLTTERIVIKRVPDLEDVRTMIEILNALEIETVFEDGVIEIKAHKSCKNVVPYHLIRKMRASFNILGPLSVMNDTAQVPLPGGCSIGPRPVDIHLMGLKKLGFDNHIEYGVVFTEKVGMVKEAVIDLPFPSVGATEQILSTAVKLEGTTTLLNNAAKEPEITQLVDFLIGMGAKIEGKGTSTLKITGVRELHGLEFEVIYDRMEAGTYLIAGLITGGEIEVEGYVEEDNIALTEVLTKLNAPFRVEKDRAFTYHSLTPMKGAFVKADVFPYFPTDMQPQMTTLLTLCQGQSVVQDVVFPERNSHAEELRRFGAGIFVRNQSIMINGVDELEGAPVMATDLRCAAALILAGLSANGDTLIQEVDHIFRGYDKITKKLRGLGAEVEIK
ncbi:MAG TPA: UDP-N-acetylglucosamine 1-carboxyvinyltransferase [Thermotogota bacterium]|nr:UDP-N-acetylglucosamine 1-carboxyvinyltransferase [Thermotogota bacterium]HPJ87927.1 UDP-N-acetylglucosamine 1-carboxyvinyltransferase [Thermotogota bacterium]HPR95020.1 UDP-N-acetylglucosamine 1-carboxyvinyltransferase [Thermotogota bacterium]